jgi:hypothetical protein
LRELIRSEIRDILRPLHIITTCVIAMLMRIVLVGLILVLRLLHTDTSIRKARCVQTSSRPDLLGLWAN